jgi:hypothetical protein
MKPLLWCDDARPPRARKMTLALLLALLGSTAACFQLRVQVIDLRQQAVDTGAARYHIDPATGYVALEWRTNALQWGESVLEAGLREAVKQLESPGKSKFYVEP